MSTFQKLLTVLACAGMPLCLCSAAHAGRGVITGREKQGWDDGVYNVVVGTLRGIRPHGPSAPSQHDATFVPRATLAGTFDPSLHPSLRVALFTGTGTTQLAEPPAEGALVLAVLRTKPFEGKEATYIYSDNCTFMPDNRGLVVIQGLDDPRVLKTLEMIQVRRAHPSDNPYEPLPATMPATRPSRG